MKKFISFLLLLTICLTLGASFLDDFSFSIANTDVLYKPYKAGDWSFISRAQYCSLIEGSGLQEFLAVSRYLEAYEDYYLNFDKVKNAELYDYFLEKVKFMGENKVTNFMAAKPSINASLCRVSYKNFSIDASLQIGLNLVINSDSQSDVIGFDGLYAYGFEMDYKNIVSAHFVKHHYSGHYSDEIEDNYFNSMKDFQGVLYSDRMKLARTVPGAITGLIEYVRQDSCQFGVSVKPVSWFRIYGEIDFLPNTMTSLKPFVIVPESIKTKRDLLMSMLQSKNEGMTTDDNTQRLFPYSDNYKDLILDAGVELSYQFGKVGTFGLSYDIRLSQEGQTYYQIGAYDENNPWYINHNVLLDFQPLNKPISIELMYHVGQFPLLNFGWYNCSYISLGFSIDTNK